jgi:type IX secretion system PorP/SprF family membrane protein
MKSALHTLFFAISILAGQLFGQDVHFSQYYFSPLSLNPANTGNYKGDYRFFGNYRSQWRELNNAYETFSVGGDFNKYIGAQNVSGGCVIINDKSGGNLSVLKIMPSGAWHFKLAGIKIHVGLQPGVTLKSINFYAHTFPSQMNWNKGQFDKDLPNNETNVGQQFTYFDLNSGIALSKRFKKYELETGFTVFHINRPKESFIDNSKNKLPMRQAINAGFKYYKGSKVIIHLYSLYGFTTKVNNWVSGVNLEYVLHKAPFYANSVFAGTMWRSGIKRNGDAGIITAGLNYKNWTLGFSYDITYSQLKTSVNSRGAYEMAFILRGKDTRLNLKTLPCERY